MTDSLATCTRRRLLLAAPATLAALTLAACAKKEPDSCTSTLGLTQEEIKTRTSLGYRDREADSNKTCLKCTQYVEPKSVEDCGSCKVLKGPVHPRGGCNVFTPKP